MEISDEEILALSSAIQKRYGVDFTTYEIKSLKRRIVRVINLFKLGSLFELWQKILKEPSFVQDFKNEISVGLTSLMRDPQLWAYLKNYLVDYYKSNSVVKIWHAGCSTGEEVYSMGIVLDEIGALHKSRSLATDLSTRSIQTAKDGKYIHQLYEDYKANYHMYNKFGKFENHVIQGPVTFQMRPRLIGNVTFKDHNLVTDMYEQNHDIIFCRNVLIYFDAATKSKILRKFYDALNPGGILIIGYFDSFIPFAKEKLFEYLDTDVRILIKRVQDKP